MVSFHSPFPVRSSMRIVTSAFLGRGKTDSPISASVICSESDVTMLEVVVLNDLSDLKVDDWQEIQKHPAVERAIPLAMGDSFQGQRIVGTSLEYFEATQSAAVTGWPSCHFRSGRSTKV